MSSLVAIRLPDELGSKLELLSQETGRTKSYYMRRALEKFLEDREDYLLALARLEENNPRVPYSKMRKELDLDD